jgi:G:T-mismatch repair DNA endonuclease (very short patch repair protein)
MKEKLKTQKKIERYREEKIKRELELLGKRVIIVDEIRQKEKREKERERKEFSRKQLYLSKSTLLILCSIITMD